jgi:hypothetical protein
MSFEIKTTCDSFTLTTNETKRLQGLHRILLACERQAPLDGGDPLGFEFHLDMEQKGIVFSGKCNEAINLLHYFEFITDEQKRATHASLQ